MDDRGYTITPLVLLLMVPIIIFAIAYGDIVNEANTMANIAMGGDVTYTTAVTLMSQIEKSASDAGRNSAYNATRKVIDDNKFFNSSTSKPYITQLIVNSLNANVIQSGKMLKNETGREIYINNIPINDYTNSTFSTSDVNITQTDPFGFYVNIRPGIPIKVVQKDQVYEGKTPPISAYVSLEGMEDPYMWLNTKNRFSNIIYKYPYHTYSVVYGHDYYFDVLDDRDLNRLYHLWDCLNGTDNPGRISPRPYYFSDPYGLSFFDRLENKTNTSSTSTPETRMSTFIIGDPLLEDHGRLDISKLDHEYVNYNPSTPQYLGTDIRIGSDEIADPDGSIFYLSTAYKTFFKLKDQY